MRKIESDFTHFALVSGALRTMPLYDMGCQGCFGHDQTQCSAIRAQPSGQAGRGRQEMSFRKYGAW